MDSRPSQQSIFLTEDQVSMVTLATTRMRDLAGNPLLDDSEVLVMIADEYLKDAEALAKLAEAKKAHIPTRRIALE